MNQLVTAKNFRPLSPSDLQRVIDIDSQYALRSRRGFFEKRLKAALEHPKRFVYLGHEASGTLQGFAMARLVEGEFGRAGRVAELDAIAVDPKNTGKGIGGALLAELQKILRDKDIAELNSFVDWRNMGMVEFLANNGFILAPRHILERDMTLPPNQTIIEDEEESYEIDHSSPQSDDAASLARDKIPCRTLRPDDLGALVSIAKAIDSGDHRDRLAREMDEAIDESGIRVSLVAELDSHIVGFVTARVDFGEFGRTEPAAVIDTIGVHPDYGHRHVGTALMGQLLANLNTLRVDAARTEVYWDEFGMLGFLKSNGFVPSQWLSFEKSLF